MKRSEPKPIAQGDAYWRGYNTARGEGEYQPIETFEWKQGFRDFKKDQHNGQ